MAPLRDGRTTTSEEMAATTRRPRLEFWFEYASTYSYPTAQRIERCADERGVEVTWRPFLLGPIFASQGWNDSPFNLYPAKGAYMWRDIERICAGYELAWRKPSAFPRSGLLAARLTVAASGESWMPDLVRAFYRANFVEDLDISDESVAGGVLAAVGQTAAPWLARARDDDVKQRLRGQTERAIRLGIFGAPSFIVDGELYWGNDRLAAALERAAAA